MLRARFIVPLSIVGALALAGPALALPHLNPAQSKRISGLVDRFVKDVVLRENLADGWRISGPQVRGVMTRRAWLSGRALPIMQLKLHGDSWAHAWYATYRTGNEIALNLDLLSGTRKNGTMYNQEVVLDLIHGKWLVNNWYMNAMMRLGPGKRGSCISSSCMITGINDYLQPGGPGNGRAPARLAGSWLLVALGVVVGLPLSGLLAYFVYARRRNRLAWQAYAAARRA